MGHNRGLSTVFGRGECVGLTRIKCHLARLKLSRIVIKKGIHGWAGHIARVKDNRWTKKSDRVDTTRMEETAGKT